MSTGCLFLQKRYYGRLIDYVYHIYPNELKIKDTTDTVKSTSYLALFQFIDNEGRLNSKLYDKRDDFNFPIANVPFLSSNIPA